MTLFYSGVKPGVGPVVKVLKYDDDDPLTLANDSYDRYYFNSENQKLAMVRDQWVHSINYATLNGTTSGYVVNFQGDNYTAKYSAAVHKITSGGATYFEALGRRQNIFKDVPYAPIPEVRVIPPSGWVTCAVRNIQWIYDETTSPFREWAVYTSSQYSSCWVKAQYNYGPGEAYRYDWIRSVPLLSYVGSSEWSLKISSFGADGTNGNAPSLAGIGIMSAVPDLTIVVSYWDMPADATPMPQYSHVPDLLTYQENRSGVILTRPGYSVASSEGTRHRILDSTISLASVIMTGVVQQIAAGQTIAIPSNIDLPMAATSVVEVMVQVAGDSQYIPPHILSGYAKDKNIFVQYKVEPYNLLIYNGGSHAINVTYIVFNIDAEPQTTGGSQVMRRISDVNGEYVQIKKPGSSDTAPKTSDVLLDQRFPTLQIVKEGYIPLADFNSPVENSNLLGNRACEISFDNNGFIPFLKYSVVFADRIMPPSMGVYSFFSTSGGTLGPPNKFSSVARLDSNKVKFWLNPGNWSSRRYVSGELVERNYGSNPLGIRYYIFGIARP